MQIKHIIWDWNGTLVDDTCLCAEILNAQLAGAGIPLLTIDQYRELFGFPLEDFYRQIGLAATFEQFRKCSAAFTKEYNRRRFECDLHESAVEVIEWFSGQGGKHSVLSAYATEYLDEMVESYGLKPHFELVRGLDNVFARSKLDEGRKLLDNLGVASKDVLLVGDTLHDYEVSEALGCRCVLVCRGHFSRERLSRCGAPVLDSLRELIPYISSQ